VGGVDKHDCFAGVESVPDGREGRVAEVFWRGGAVGGEEDDAVCLQGVEGVKISDRTAEGSAERSGTLAKKPKRFLGAEARRLKMKSLQARARVAAARGSDSMPGPGAVQERMAVVMPCLVQMSSSKATVHGGMYHPEGSPPLRWRASVKTGGYTWWCTSILPGVTIVAP